MTKPWEETWSADTDDGSVTRTPHGERDERVILMRARPRDWPNVETAAAVRFDNECAQLLAAAPDMARALLELEDEGRDVGGDPCCPACGEGRVAGVIRHRPTCALNNVLRKAGVRP